MEKDNIAWQNLTHKAPIILFCHISNIRKKVFEKIFGDSDSTFC